MATMERRCKDARSPQPAAGGPAQVSPRYRLERPFSHLQEYRPRQPRFARLSAELRAADGRRLAPAEQFLHPQFIDSLHRALSPAERLATPLRATRLYHDLDHYFGEPRYEPIFGKVRRRDEIFWLVRDARLPQALAVEMGELRRIAPWAYEHALASAATAVLLLKHVLPEEELLAAALVAFAVRDVGLSRIDRSILLNRSKLSPRRFCAYMDHELISGALVGRALGASTLATRIALRHHRASPLQRWVPQARGPRPEELSAMHHALEVAEAYIGMTAPRPFRSGSYSPRGALDTLLGQAQRGDCDPQLVRLLIAYSRKQVRLSGIRVSRRREGLVPAVNHFGVAA